ncbi:hypothetical protein EJV47_27615 [Hymenobacter gummosus]|uniref:site-specific DNA-methyltransferase (adenine-specific) n=1 Tax=Hymenobacter gummosus TaxID=1776032 RepID=A0A431TUI0_9BACT|nr:N-6 DNA methylase [Hymenobacter gummosus]RTQ44661.1 hypothetical protein EJV47_27615 [Hymenobacter gummosus]
MQNNIEQLIAFEDKYINQVVALYLSAYPDVEQLSEEEINALLVTPGPDNVVHAAHNAFMRLVAQASLTKSGSQQLSVAVELVCGQDSESPSLASLVSPPTATAAELEQLHMEYLGSEFNMRQGITTRKKSKLFIKETGAVYTLPEICREIVSRTIERAVSAGVEPGDIKCLDFAAGTGRFYFIALDILHIEHQLPLEHILTHSLYAVDLDETAVLVLKYRLVEQLTSKGISLSEDIFKNIVVRNALMPGTGLLDSKHGINLFGDYDEVSARGGFDVVFSNPPYCLLKANKKGGHEHLAQHYQRQQARIQGEISFFRTSGLYQYSVEGMLNYYQLSIEMILRLTRQGGRLGIICPSSLFADLTAAKLRQHLLTRHQVEGITYFPESARLFEGVAQATVIFYAQKGGATNRLQVSLPGSNSSFSVDLATIKRVFDKNLEVPLIDETGWSILSKLAAHKRLKEVPFIRNRRGELDLTLFKAYITSTDTGWNLIRGSMLGKDGISRNYTEFVEAEAFLLKKSADYRAHDFGKPRLVCQQVSNMDIQRRVRFLLCGPQDILGNSCNYLTSTRDQDDLVALQTLLNSALLNWRFKVTSSNNHINNYELDELPILDLDVLKTAQLTDDEQANDRVICALYGLSEEETNYIVSVAAPKKKRKKHEHQTV